MMDLLLNRAFWFLILGGFTVMLLVVFVLQQRRKLGEMGGRPTIAAQNGTGTALLFFRPIDHVGEGATVPGTFEATIWYIVCALPVLPLSAWFVRPISIRRSRTGLNRILTTYDVDFIQRIPLQPLRVIWMYINIAFHLSVTVVPAAVTTLAWICCDNLPGWRWLQPFIPWVAVVSFLWLWGYPLFLLLRKDRYFPVQRP